MGSDTILTAKEVARASSAPRLATTIWCQCSSGDQSLQGAAIVARYEDTGRVAVSAQRRRMPDHDARVASLRRCRRQKQRERGRAGVLGDRPA
jgi:hypothetical protein